MVAYVYHYDPQEGEIHLLCRLSNESSSLEMTGTEDERTSIIEFELIQILDLIGVRTG